MTLYDEIHGFTEEPPADGFFLEDSGVSDVDWDVRFAAVYSLYKRVYIPVSDGPAYGDGGMRRGAGITLDRDK